MNKIQMNKCLLMSLSSCLCNFLILFSDFYLYTYDLNHSSLENHKLFCTWNIGMYFYLETWFQIIYERFNIDDLFQMKEKLITLYIMKMLLCITQYLHSCLLLILLYVCMNWSFLNLSLSNTNIILLNKNIIIK